MTEEFETSLPVVPGLDDNYFATIVAEFLAEAEGVREGSVGDAPGTLVDAAAITAFAIGWLERRFG
jgi:aminoglycoside 3-N-acetyltransferase